MKKYLILFLVFCTLLSTTVYAETKKSKTAALDFTLSYKPQLTEEHVMKNVVKLQDSNWQVAGKLVTAGNSDVLLFMVRSVSHHNNKYNLEYMLIDSRNNNTYVSSKRVTAVTGLPMQLSQDNVKMNLLVNLS